MARQYDEFFKQYEILAKAAEQIFHKVKAEYPEGVTCKIECSDCCHAIFDISLVEALYLNFYFDKIFKDEEKNSIMEKANRADRVLYKIKRDAKKRLDRGHTEESLMVSLAAERVRCPLLNDREQCDLYEYRPVTCRFYGVPTEIGGVTHTCGKSGFIKGTSYPTVHLEKMNTQLFNLTSALVQTLNSKYSKLSAVVMPVSSALLTTFDDEFLGIIKDEEKIKTEDKED